MIPLHEPAFNDADFKFLNEALRSNWVSTGGPFVDQFEKDFAAYVGAKFAVSTCNGTVAIQLMLETLRREQGIDGPFDVIVPDLSFIATANAVVHAGGWPVFADCSASSMNMSADSVAEILKSYRRDARGLLCSQVGRPLLAIMPAHIMGWLSNVDGVRKLANEFSVPLVEDAAESLGSRTMDHIHGGKAGIAAAYSFNGNKILTTGGGGMLVSDDEAFAKRAKHLSTTAKTDSLRYLHDEVGYNYRLVNLLAAIGVSQLQRMPQTLRRKQEIFDTYCSLIQKEIPGDMVRVYQESHCQPNHWLVNLVFKDEALREKALKELVSAGVGARPLWAPFHWQTALKSFPQVLTQWRHTTWFWERTLSLPSSSHIELPEMEQVVGTIKKALKSV